MQYGKITKPKELMDEMGSSKQIIETYRGGAKKVVTRYEVRLRVKNETEELAEFIKHKKEHIGQHIEFVTEKQNDPKKDYYHIVKIWEE